MRTKIEGLQAKVLQHKDTNKAHTIAARANWIVRQDWEAKPDEHDHAADVREDSDLGSNLLARTMDLTCGHCKRAAWHCRWPAMRSSSLSKLPDLDLELFARRLGVSEKHLGVIVEEYGVLHVGVPRSKGTLHHNNLWHRLSARKY